MFVAPHFPRGGNHDPGRRCHWSAGLGNSSPPHRSRRGSTRNGSRYVCPRKSRAPQEAGSGHRASRRERPPNVVRRVRRCRSGDLDHHDDHDFSARRLFRGHRWRRYESAHRCGEEGARLEIRFRIVRHDLLPGQSAETSQEGVRGASQAKRSRLHDSALQLFLRELARTHAVC